MRLLLLPLLLSCACAVSAGDAARGGGNDGATGGQGGSGGRAVGGGGAGGVLGGGGSDGGGGGVTEPLELLPGLHVEGLALQTLVPGAVVQLRAAPQGGQYLWVGARVRGLKDPTARLHATLTDLESGAIVGEAESFTEFVPDPAAPCWSEPDGASIVNFAMLQVCPNLAQFRVEGRELLLRVELEELVSGRTVGAESPLVPGCLQVSPEFCQCECDPGFSFDKCGPPHG